MHQAVGQARRAAAQRQPSRAADARAPGGMLEVARAQLAAQDARLIEAAAALAAERRERLEWQRIAAERAQRIVELEHRLQQC